MAVSVAVRMGTAVVLVATVALLIRIASISASGMGQELRRQRRRRRLQTLQKRALHIRAEHSFLRIKPHLRCGGCGSRVGGGGGCNDRQRLQSTVKLLPLLLCVARIKRVVQSARGGQRRRARRVRGPAWYISKIVKTKERERQREIKYHTEYRYR